MISSLLSAKQALIGTTAGRLFGRARWWAGAWQRFRHPELWDMYLEEQRMETALAEFIESDFNCVDVGAHIGSTLTRLVELAPNGQHLAIEPVPAKAHSLRERFPDVAVLNAAVSSSPGAATLYEAKKSGFSSLRPPVHQEVVGKFEVDVVRLDDVIETDARVDFIKLDVEGAELLVLEGGIDTLKRERPVVLFECGPTGHTEVFEYSRADVFAFFVDLDYSVYSVADFVYGRVAMTVEEFEKAGTYPYSGFNYFAVPAEFETHRILD